MGSVGTKRRWDRGRGVRTLMACLAASSLALAAGGARAQAPEVRGVTVTVAPDGGSLEIELAEGRMHAFSLRDGRIAADGEEIGTYRRGGALQSSWQDLLREALDGDPPTYGLEAERLISWDPPRSGAPDASVRALVRAIRDALDGGEERGTQGGGEESAVEAGAQGEGGSAPAGTVTVTGPEGGRLSIAPGRLSFDVLVERLARLDAEISRLGEEAREATRDLALIVHDDWEIPRGETVAGNLALVGGELRLEGSVEGDALVLDGTLLLEPSGHVEGDLLQVGGDVRRRGGALGGEFVSLKRVSPPPRVDVPDVGARVRERVREGVREHVRGPSVLERTVDNVARGLGGVLGVAGKLIVLGILGSLAVLFTRPQLEVVADTARHNFGRALGVGLAGEVLFFPILLVLVVGVITWLVIPFYLLGAALAAVGGYVAVAHAAGEMLARGRFRYEWLERMRRSNSYYYVLSGLVVLLLPFAVAEALHIFGYWLDVLRGLVNFVAVVGTWVLATVGLGAILLSRAGTRPHLVPPEIRGAASPGGSSGTPER